MNDYEMKNESSSPSTYHATANLNTALENPQINMNNAMGVNISNLDNNNFYSDSGSGSQNLENGYSNIDYSNVPFQAGTGSNLNQGVVNNGEYYSNVSNQSSYSNLEQVVPDSSQQTFVQGMSQNPYQNHIMNDMSMTDQSYSMVGGNVEQTTRGSTNFVPNNVGSEPVNVQTGMSEQKIMYEPTLDQKKKSPGGVTIPKEVTLTLFIVFILFIFILVMPYIYDFLKQLQLTLTT